MTKVSGVVSRPLGLWRGFLLLASILLAAASVLHYLRDQSLRKSAERFARRFALPPSELNAMRLEPAGDLALAVAVDAAMREAEERSSLASVPRRNAPPESFSRREERLSAARDLILLAVASRPGWAYHRFLLGQVVLIAQRNARAAGAAGRLELWGTPLRLAAAAAPGADIFWTAAAEAYLESWRELSPAMREEAFGVFKRAFASPGFVSRGFLSAVSALGREEAVRLLPESPELLAMAAQSLLRKGDVASGWLLLQRRERAERKERAADLSKIEERSRVGDVDNVRELCRSWVSEHPVNDFDDPLGRSQVARVLQLWPRGQAGDWALDPRGELASFFLDGREGSVSPSALAEAVGSLSDVPEVVQARVRLAAGDLEGAEEIASQAEGVGGPEWTPYFVALGRFHSRRGDPGQAGTVLGRVAGSSREECGVLLARREVARALGDRSEIASVSRTLEALGASEPAGDTWSDEGTLPLCVDPQRVAGRSLTVELVAESPAIVRYGWDRGQLGTVFVDSSRTIAVPLAGLTGRHSFSLRVLAGSARAASVDIRPEGKRDSLPEPPPIAPPRQR